MFEFFAQRAVKKAGKALQKKYAAKLAQALAAQRNGKIALFADLTAEAELIRLELEEHEKSVPAA
ncbi:MAG: DUF6435 family protein [Pseudomonadales bacterium]